MPQRAAGLWVGATLIMVAAMIGALVMVGNARSVRDRIVRRDPDLILADTSLAPTAIAIGREGYVKHCSSCHGQGKGDRSRGIPDLTDGAFLYGTGQVGEIEQIVLHGIRAHDSRGWQLASMPAYAHPRPYAAEPIPPMSPGQIRDVVQLLLRKHGAETDPAAADRGARLYAGSGGCYDCHGQDGAGDNAIGAPSLVGDAWLYGGSPETLTRTLAYGRAGVSPAFDRFLTPLEARAIAVYVAALSQHPPGFRP